MSPLPDILNPGAVLRPFKIRNTKKVKRLLEDTIHQQREAINRKRLDYKQLRETVITI